MNPSAAPAPLPGLYDLDKQLINDGFLDGNGSLTVGVTNQTNPIALHKIATNEALGDTEFIVDNIEATTNAGVSGITFLAKSGSVGFNASEQNFAELAVFPDPTSKTFSDALGAVSDTHFSLAPDPNLTAVMLRWGADATASGKGSIALGGGIGTIDFSGSATGDLFFAVIQQVERSTPTDTALRNVVKNWKLPVHVRTADDLAPSTHILSEVGGSLTTSISATFGHEFNWLRQITVQGKPALSGDIGLKLELGLTASFGITTQGKFAVAVSRETADPVIRVRIFKLGMNEFDFALSASAAATPTIPAPANYTDLVKATLGVHPAQILAELEDPATIDNWIKTFGPDYVTSLLKKFTGLDLAAALAKVNDLASRWKNLPASTASLFEKLAESAVPDFSDIQKAAGIIAAGDTAALKSFLEAKIASLDSPFLQSPLGKFLEGLAESGGMTLLQNIPTEVANAAKQVSNFFSGAPIETLLNQIVTDIDTRLGLDAILNDLQGDPATVLDKLLFDRLTAFLGRQPALKDIQELQQSIKTLLDKAGTLYNKTVAALTSTYTAQLNASYQQTASNTALIDASFTFAGSDAEREAVASSLRQLLAGQLDDFLTKPAAGVKLANGALTHQVKRHSHVDLTLPFLKLEGDWISTATTKFNAIDQSNGRLAMYQLDATGQDIHKATFTSLWTGRNWRSTTVSIAGQLSGLLPRSCGCRVYPSTPTEMVRSASSSAAIRLEVQNLTLDGLEANVEPFATVLMHSVFPDHATFEKWTQMGHLLTKPGNTLVSMDITVPAKVPLAWMQNKVSAKNDPLYQKLSLQLQFLLKHYLPFYYFQDIKAFEALDPAYLVLLYAALPRRTSAHDIYWDFQDQQEVTNTTNTALDNGSFGAQLSGAQTRLRKAGLNDLAGRYDPASARKLFATATNATNLNNLHTLLLMENGAISDARDAAVSAAQFNQLMAANKPAEALNALADFGNGIVSAFNHDLSSLFVQKNDALQRLSPLIFAQAATVFDSTVPVMNFNTILGVTVLNEGVAMPTNFPDFTVDQKDILVALNAASFKA